MTDITKDESRLVLENVVRKLVASLEDTTDRLSRDEIELETAVEYISIDLTHYRKWVDWLEGREVEA